MIGKEPQKGKEEEPKKESIMEKIMRITNAGRDSLNVLIPYINAVKSSDSDEEMRNRLQELFKKSPVISYADYVNKVPKNNASQREFDVFMDQLGPKIDDITKKINSDDATRKEVLTMWNDLWEYTKSPI